MNPIISEILDILLRGIITVVIFGLFAVSIIGCFLLLNPLLKRRPNLYRFRGALDSAVPEKQELTKYQRHIWVQKIQEFRKINLKKILASKVNSKSMTLSTIIVIVLTVLFWLFAVMMRFRAK